MTTPATAPSLKRAEARREAADAVEAMLREASRTIDLPRVDIRIMHITVDHIGVAVGWADSPVSLRTDAGDYETWSVWVRGKRRGLHDSLIPALRQADLLARNPALENLKAP